MLYKISFSLVSCLIQFLLPKTLTNRSTNASAESFNAKIKAFRMQLRGVRNKEFFRINLKSCV
ncbi:transposase [Formosa sp. A9]|uniref:transposase n=1 Tax=Formosa sp. A9 TaxID=3442641 RepID=UPI003EC11E78